MIKQWKIQFIHNMILLRITLLIRKARTAIIQILMQYFRGLCNISLALVALYFVGGIHNILHVRVGT